MMPEVEIKSYYSVKTTTEQSYVSFYDDIIPEFLEFFKETRFYSEEDLKNTFVSFIESNYDTTPDLAPEEEFYGFNLIEILNWPKVYSALNHLIVADKRNECCIAYLMNGGFKYCPICGTKY